MAQGPIKAQKQWRYVGHAVGTNSVTLPTDNEWEEIYVDARFGLNPLYGFNFHRIRSVLTNATGNAGCYQLNGSYISATDAHSCALTMLKTSVALKQWQYNGQDRVSSGYIDVYVR